MPTVTDNYQWEKIRAVINVIDGRTKKSFEFKIMERGSLDNGRAIWDIMLSKEY